MYPACKSRARNGKILTRILSKKGAYNKKERNGIKYAHFIQDSGGDRY
jgi:hypothetical protein